MELSARFFDVLFLEQPKQSLHNLSYVLKHLVKLNLFAPQFRTRKLPPVCHLMAIKGSDVSQIQTKVCGDDGRGCTGAQVHLAGKNVALLLGA